MQLCRADSEWSTGSNTTTTAASSILTSTDNNTKSTNVSSNDNNLNNNNNDTTTTNITNNLDGDYDDYNREGCYVYRVVCDEPLIVRSTLNVSDEYRTNLCFQRDELVSIDQIHPSRHRDSPNGPFLRLSDCSGWTYERKHSNVVMERLPVESGLWRFYVEDNNSANESLRRHPFENSPLVVPAVTYEPFRLLYCDCKVVDPKLGTCAYRVQGSGGGWVLDTERMEESGVVRKHRLLPDTMVRRGLFAFEVIEDIESRTVASTGEDSRTGQIFDEGDVVIVDVIKESPWNNGIGPFLRLEDGSGWVFLGSDPNSPHDFLREIPIEDGEWVFQIVAASIKPRRHPIPDRSDMTVFHHSTTYTHGMSVKCDKKITVSKTTSRPRFFHPNEVSCSSIISGGSSNFSVGGRSNTAAATMTTTEIMNYYRVKGTTRGGWLYEKERRYNNDDDSSTTTQIMTLLSSSNNTATNPQQQQQQQPGWTEDFVRGIALAFGHTEIKPPKPKPKTTSKRKIKNSSSTSSSHTTKPTGSRIKQFPFTTMTFSSANIKKQYPNTPTSAGRSKQYPNTPTSAGRSKQFPSTTTTTTTHDSSSTPNNNNNGMISFQTNSGERINVYYRTRTIGTPLNNNSHKNSTTNMPPQLFRRNCTDQDMITIMQNPLSHTSKEFKRRNNKIQQTPHGLGVCIDEEEDVRNDVLRVENRIKQLQLQRNEMFRTLRRSFEDARVREGQQFKYKREKYEKSRFETEMSLTCLECDRQFVSTSVRNQHCRNVHGLECKTCKQIFNSKKALDKHKEKTFHW